MTRCLIVAIGFVLLSGCAGSRQTTENPELQVWVGTWQGLAVQENRADPPRQWTLLLSLKNGRLRGVMSDDTGELRRKKLDDVRVVGGELNFSINYENARGLQVICRHRATLQEDKLLSVFEGREGGRSFAGKWEAQRLHGIEALTQ